MALQIYWVTGMMGAGKTTYLKRIEQSGGECLYIGKLCREKFGSGEMAKDAQAAAPEYTEEFVRKTIVDKIASMGDQGTLAVDGVPRKPAQVRWIKENFPDSTIVYLSADMGQRMKRVGLRDAGKQGDLDLAAARFAQEPDLYLRVLEMVGMLGMKAFYHDTTEGMRPDIFDSVKIERHIPVNTNLVQMFESHRKFSDLVLSKLGLDSKTLYDGAEGLDKLPQMHPSAQWARKFTEKAVGELQELMRELPDEWWTLDEVDIRKARVELIDAWHFFISIANALGMDAQMFSNTFYGKLNVNFERQAKGYIKKEKIKGDDAHVGTNSGPERTIEDFDEENERMQ